MSKTKATDNPLGISEETRKKASEMIEGGVRLISEQMKQLAEEVREFEVDFRETTRRIRNGARRTSGRIV
jgi:hypothetical protein